MATIQEAYQAACNAGFIKRNEFSEEAFGNMLQDDNNRRAYYDHVTKIDPTFYSKDYDTFSQNVLSALGKPNAKNSTNQPSNAPAPSQVQPTFQPAQGQPTFWQSIGAHDPYPQKTAEGVTQFEKEQQLQRESAATMPLSQQDKDRQAEIQRLQTEGIWGKPNGITMDIDKQTGLPTINQTKGDGMHLSIGATPSNQDEIDRLKAEQPAYITREIKTPQDLYTSVSEAWAANTPDGQKAKAELDKTAQDTYNNLLADMNRQIADLQQQVNNGTVTQQQAQQEAQRIADNTNAVYENEMQPAQDYFFRQMTDANADYLSQQARLLGQKATNQTISDINARIAPHIRQLETERQQAMQRASQSVQAQGGMYGAIGASMSANTAYKPEKDQELALYHQSQQFLADAAKISDAAQKGEGFWKGLGKSLGDIDTWDFGISQLTRSANLKDIVEKYERGEQLTDAEKGLMDSAVAYMSACAYNSDKINRRYKMGQTTGESIPFMLQFMVMPIGAIKDKVAKGVLGYGIEQFGGKAAQAAGKVAAKYGAKTAFKEAGTALLSNLAAAGVQTAAFGVPKIAEGAISRMTGDIQPTITEQGNIAYNGRRNQQSAASAVWNSAVDMYAENLSEMILTSLDPLKAYAGTAKLFSGLKNSQIAQVLGRLNEGVIGKVRDRVQFRNYLEEVGEEYVGNLIRWGLSTDVNNAEDAGLSADRQIDTWLGLAPTSIAFGAANIVEGGIDRFQSSRAAKRLREIMADGDKRRYLESLLKSRNSDDFSKNAHEVIKSVLRDKELNEDTKRLIMDGIYYTYQSQLAQEAEQARVQAEAERQTQPEQQPEQSAQQEIGQQTASAAESEANQEGEEHYQDADGNEVTFYRNADGSVSLRDENDNAAVDEHGNAVVLTQAEFDKYTQDTNLRRVDRELSADQWAERENELRQQYASEIRPNTHNDGNVYEVALASDGNKHGYIVGDGNVEIDDTTDHAAQRITNSDVVTVRYEDGTMEQVAAKDLNLLSVGSANDIVEQRLQPFQQYAQAMQTFRAGQEVTMDDGSGNTYTSHVVSVSTDGVEVEIENAQGEPDTTIIPNEIALTALHPVEQRQRQPEQQVEKQEPFEFVKTDPFGNPIVVEQPEQIPTTPQKIVPNIDTMLADELGASVVEYLGDKASAIAYLEAERDKADDDVKRLAKQKVTRYTDIADFKRQNDELQAAKKAAADRYNKLQNAIATANNYKTKVEQAAEAERKAREEERRATRRQTQTAQLTNAAPAERWKAAPKVEGNAVTRTLSDGTIIKGHYILVEAGAATPSHDPFNGWNTSNGFPVTDDGKNINDRDYKNDTDAQQITTQIAQTYDGQAVAQVPVVSSEGIVYDGNGRTIAGNIAAANNTDGAYIQALADNAGNFGFAPEQVAGMQHPRVYMQTDEDLPYNTTTFAKFNAQEKKSQGSTNRAVSSSKKLTEAARDGMLRILDNYGTLDAFFASENGAKDIVRSLLDNGIITQQEVAGLTENTDRGFVLSPAGKDYVTDLLIGGLFDEQTIRMLGNDKGLKQSILRAMPSIVENRRLGDYALTDNINNAIRLLYEARQAGMAYPLYVKQGNAFDGYVSDRFSPFEMLLAEEMSSGVETFRQVLNLYNNSARDEANGQTGLFEPRTFDDIKKEILQHYGKSTDQSAAIAAESTQSRPANTQTEPPVPSTPTGDGQEQIATDIPASNILEQIEAEAEPFEEIELTPANWYALFGEDGIVSTPIGYVKMGEHQYLKLAQKGRDGKLGMIKPTLEHPSVVVMDKSQAKDGQNTEREFSYVFVKAFVGKNGERLYYFTSITVSKDGQEVVISNQEKERSRIQRLLKNGKLAYINKATLPPASDKTIQGDQLTNPVGEELSSADKGTKNIPNSQTPEQKSAENLPNASQDEQSHTEEAPKDEQSKDNGGKEQSQSQQSENKIFTEDAYEAARRRMHERLNRLNAGLDPEMLSDGLIMAGYHVEKGARKFAEFAREMIREFGDKIRPYLKSFYNGLRDLPEAVDLSKEMDDYSTVMQFDVNSISIERAKETEKSSNTLLSVKKLVTLQPEKVYVEGLFGALNTKGEAKLSDHTEQRSSSLGENERYYTCNGESIIVDRSDYKTYLTDKARALFAELSKTEKKHLAIPSAAYISYASIDGVKIPAEVLLQDPNIQAAQAKIDERNKQSLQLTEEQEARYVSRLFDSEHGSAVLNKDGKINKRNGEEDFSGEVVQDRKALFVIGRPAGGKSSVYANPLSAQYKARIIDSDVVKPWLDGFDGGDGAGYVQAASSNVADKALEMAIRRGDNVVIPKIGGNSIIKMAVKLRQAGYSVELYYNEVSEESSIMRASARFAETGRYLAIDYLESIKNKAEKTFINYANKTLKEVQDERPELFMSAESVDAGGYGQNSGLGLGENEKSIEDGGTDAGGYLFSRAEWKNNDVGFGEPTKFVWSSDSKMPIPGTDDVRVQHKDRGTTQNGATPAQTIGTISQSTHTKTGEAIFVVKPSERVSDDEFKLLKARAKANNGYYSSFAKNRGFIFKSKEDANNFNNISDEEITTDQTSADTETAVRTAETVVGETATITRDRRDSNRAEGEPGTESIEGGVREPRNVELTPEQANEQVTTRQQAIAKIDNANDKITDQLAVLGFYEADTSDPTKLHESYGYIKTAEAKAVKDIDRLAKQLADDLGIKVSKRKTIAKANIAPAGGDISFRLPLENGKELYLSVDIEPNFNNYYRADGDANSLVADHMFWRIEDPQANGTNRYLTPNQNYGLFERGQVTTTYADLLRDIRRMGRDYLSAIPTGTTMQEVAKQVAEKTTRKKKDTTRIADTQSMLDLFGDVAETMNEGAQQEHDEPERKFVNAVSRHLLGALVSEDMQTPFRSILDLRKLAKESGIEVDDNGKTDILLQELVEDGLVRAARQLVASGKYGDAKSKATYDAIVHLYEIQPTIAQRSSNRIAMQQYSTPLPMAFVADMFAYEPNMRSILEPTAGNGMLVFAVPAEKVHANELDETRLANLHLQEFQEVTSQDATEPFGGGKRYDAIIANPPFGSREEREYDGKMIAGLDPQITLNALASMKDSGKAAIIIGGNMEYADNGSVKDKKAFWSYLYDHYNVKGVVDMDGQLYRKQGTTYPTRMILIDGRRSEAEREQTTVYPPIQQKAIAKVNTFDDLYNTIAEITNSNKKTNGTEILRTAGGSSSVSDSNNTSGNTGVLGHSGKHSADDGNGRDGGQRPTDSTGSAGGNRPNDVGGVSPTSGASGRKVSGHSMGGVLRPQEPVHGLNTTSNDGSFARPERTTTDGERSGKNNVGRSGRVPVDGIRELGTPGDRVGLKPQQKRNLTEEKLPYRPHNTAFSLQSVAPAAMVEAMDNTLSQIEQSVGKSIDQFITDELGYDTIQDAHNALAAEQMDSVAMAIYQMQKGQALIIGDQTGVGKGRQMAALIRWAVRQGKKPIFITQKADLFSDIYRDLVDIGSGDLRPFIFNSATAKDGKGIVVDANGNEIYKALSDEKTKLICLQSNELPDGFDYVLATYSQFNSGDNVSRKAGVKKKKELDEDKVAKATFLRKLSRDNYLFLDESHTAAGESNTGTFFQSIIGEKGEDGVRAVTFASATFAKRPDTMPMYALRTAMAEANVEREKLIGIIEKGGVTLQEIMSRALTESGQMVRRERDMTDVKTDWKTIDDPATTKRAREQYDRTIVAFNAIIDFQDKFITPLVKEQDRELAEVMSTANLKKGTKKFGVDNTPFASKTFNYTKQLMLALKVDAIVDEVEREIKAGRHPVIALESTMESTIKDYTPGETIAEPSFSASLLKGLDNCMQYTVKDDRSKETHMTYTPNELGEEGETAYYKLQDFIRESTKDIFISPLDAIIERLHEKGYRVGELTGRNTYVERTDDGKIVVRRRTDKDKKRMQREFNSGALDVLILNKSASTGISLHASEKFSDQRQRSMIIAQPLSDINDYMQMIGRIDRTGQVHRGYYINLGLPVPAESRFLMMLSTKLKSLNANTTTSQDSESNEVDAPDLLNKYGSQVVIEYLRDNPTIYEKIGEPLKKNSKKGDDKIIHANELDEYTPSEDDALKITGRVALLNTKEQEEFYNDVVRRYNDLIRYLNDTGTNDLKITTLPLRAKTISRKVSSAGREPNGNNPFAGNAYVEQVEMDVLRKPMKANEVQKLIVQLNGTSDRAAGRKRVKDIMSIVERETEDKMTLENERYENAKQKAALTLEEYARKINANEKMSSEQKATTIEQKQQETEQKLADKNRDNILSIQHKAAYLNRMLDMFTVGETYLVPDDLGSAMFSSSTHSIFCGYKVKDNKISASTSFAVFATLDGRRKVEIKLSDISILNRINDHTNRNWDAAQQTTLDNWDKQIPTQTRKEGYIMTGNILQAVADTQDEYGNYTGQLISYTDIDGNIHDGILMPDKWKTSQLRGGVPISARLEQMKQGTVVSTDGKVTIRRGWGAPDVYFLIVPKSKSEGGKYFLNPDILRLVEGNNFYTVRGHMQAEVPAQNIEAVLGILSYMGVKAQDSTIEAQYDELDYDTDNLTDAQQFDTDVLLGALDEAGISVERVSEEDAERELNSRQILEKSQKSTTFVPTSKVPKSELAVAHKALFAKVQDQSEAGIVYGVFSANYYHIFNGNQHQYAVRIEGNEDIISDIQKEIQYGTNKNANPLSQWVTDIQSGKGYDSRDNANATEQRGGDVDANALYGRQPTDSQRDSQESNGDSGITTPLRTTSGVIHGYAKDGKIYLTDKGFNPNTPIHEYTHLWVKAVRNNNAELYDNLRDLFSRENLPDMWNELDNDPQYRDLSDEAKLSEIIARFSGKRGAERMEQEAQKLIDDAKQEGKRAVADAVSFRERMRNLLRRFWNWVGEHLFRIKNFGSREEAADRVLYDLLNGTDLHQSPAEKDSQAEFSTSPMPKRMDGEMVHEWAKRIAEWKRQQVDEQQVAEYAKLLDQNNSKKSRAFAYVVDKFTPIDNFQQWVQAQGGVYNHDTMDMHSDISLALGRIETYSRRYKNDYMQRIADSIAQIAKDNHIADPLLALGLKWQNFDNKKMNGKPLTVREIMGVYAQAKDTWEADQQGLSDRGAQGFVKNLGVSHTDIIEAVERIIPQKQLDEFWNAVYAANQFALDYQLNAGMLDTDTRNRYTRRYYVPQRGWRERDFDGKDTAYIKGNGTRLYGNPYNAALVKAHGRESLASDPFALIESIGLTSITQSEHNKSKQQLLNLLLANEMLGLKSGAWRVKQVWSKNVIDPRTGHIMRKPDGTPMQAEVTYAAPTQQEREHDADINAQIEQLRKELRDLTQPTARAKREAEIANLQDQLIYTGRATDTMLEHRTRDERLQHQIIVLHNGQQYVIELQDERLANAVNGNFGEAVKAYALFNKYNAPAIRYISGMLTQYNPRFAHRNFWRDAQAAFLNNLSEQGVAFTTRAMANIPMVQRTVWRYILADTYKGKEEYTGLFGDYLREYFEAGAQTGFSFMPELERMAKDFDKMVKGENAWDKVWGKGVKGTLSLMTEASELTVRFAEYVTARQMGRSVQEAAKMAKNISVNFNQSGLLSKEMSKFFTFFNATIQGNMRFLMPYGKNKPKFGERAFKFGAKFAGMAANFALLGLFSTFLQPDAPDDDTWFTEYDRMSNFILFGKVKIPIVHFFRMFYAAGVQAALAAQGRKTWKDAFYTSADYALGELVPASALQVQNLWDYDKTTNTIELNPAKYAQAAAPSVISPLVDVAVNRDFKGSTVYRKKWDNDKKDITTAKRNTPQWAVDVSNTLHRWSGGNPDVPYKGGNTDGWIDIKPNAIEHLAQGYLSGAWEGLGHTAGFIWDGAHDADVFKHATNWPFLRDLFRDYSEEKAYNQQYYSVLQKLKNYEKRVNTLPKEKFNAEKQTNRFRTFKQVSRQLRRLPNPYDDEETKVTSGDVNKILQLDIQLNRNLFDN